MVEIYILSLDSRFIHYIICFLFLEGMTDMEKEWKSQVKKIWFESEKVDLCLSV